MTTRDVPNEALPWGRRAPGRAFDIGLVAVVALIQIGGTAGAAARHGGRPLGVGGVLLLAAGALALLFRRRYPVDVLAVTFVTTLAYWSLPLPRGPIFAALVVAFASVVITGHRTAALWSLVLGFVAFPWLPYLVGNQSAPSLANIVGLGAWLFALFALAEVVRARRERVLESARSHEEAARRQIADERLRIARELHDSVAHTISLINLQAGVALHLIDDDPAQARRALATIKDVSKESLVELRSILGVLRQVDEDVPRAPTPGLVRLPELVERSRVSGVHVTLDVDGAIDHLPRNLDLAAYRIVQESLTNVARHSDRPKALVRIRADQRVLGIEVADEGSGRDVSPDAGGGNGIAGMKERAASVGGWLDAGPRLGGGFVVRARLPLASSS
ncbi:MAG TPA: sensor histidine kinase [Acidimicrobiia bacterium]